MALWDDIGRNVGNFFGGIFGGNDKKKKEEEQNNNIARSSSSRPIQQTSGITQSQQPQLQVQKPRNIFDNNSGLSTNLRLPGTPTNKVQVAPTPTSGEIKDNRPYPARTFNYKDANTALKLAKIPDDKDGYIKSDADKLRAELQKPSPNERFVKGLTQSVRNRVKERLNAPQKSGITPGIVIQEIVKAPFKLVNDTVVKPTAQHIVDAYSANAQREEAKNAVKKKTGRSAMFADPTYQKFQRETIDIAERDGSITPERANQLRAEFDAKAGAVTKAVKDVRTESKAKYGTDIPTASEAFWKTALPVAEVGTIGGGKAIVSGGRAIGQKILPWVTKQAERALGRTLTREEVVGATNKAAEIEKELAREATKTRIEVQQPKSIGISDASGEMTNIPVRENNTARTPIKEVGGDTPGVNQVKIPTAEEKIAQRINEQPSVNPDKRIEGITPYNTGNTGEFTRAEINAEKMALESALKNGEIDRNAYLAANESLSQLRAIDDPAPEGAKIEVKQVQDIPVVDKTEVPVGLPEAPGTIRATVSTSPNAAKSAQVARQSISLPPEVQAVLDSPKKFSKAQVAAARNQRKLAMQMAKTQEQTAEALARIESVSPAAQSSEGFVPTGEFGKSVNGGAYQKTSRASEMQAAVQETANLSSGDVIRTARETAAQNGGGFNRRDIRNIAALFETKRLERGSPEWQEARQILKEDGTNWGQTGALRNYTMRRNASSDELISRYESKIYRLADDPSKIDSKLFDQVDAAETNFVETRDAATRAYNQFEANPTSANAKAYHAAQDAADKADVAAKQVEYTVAQKALKGNKDIQQARELEKMAQSADMYQMDAVDASMLSGTGTFVRNFVNASISGIEESIFGKAGARIASLTPGARKNDIKVGGGGIIRGTRQGAMNVVDASKARAGAAGKNPIEHLKNWATTGNQLGDAVIDSQVTRSTLDHYTQMLKSEGYKGRELRDRASVMARQDPNGIIDQYQNAARIAAGLGNGVTRNNKVETFFKNIISDKMSGGNPNAATENTAKLIVRLTLGFPTAIRRSVVEGAKRTPLVGQLMDGVKIATTKNPQLRAIAIKEAIKHAGSGTLAIPPIFYALGASGAITGSYPDSQEERDRWEREGITENSIKIGDDYYQLPAYLGSWAIPGLFYAGLGRNGGDWGAAASDVAKAAPDLLPTGGIDSVLDVINGRKPIDKYLSQLIPSAVRASTPAGALLNQLAKSLDPTQNDTNTGEVMTDAISKIMSGIPIASNLLPDKTDSEGNVLNNADPFALALGAASTEQEAGVQQSEALNAQTNSYVQEMTDMGVFTDPNLKAVITDTDDKKIYQDVLGGKQVNPGDLEKLQKAMVKGVEADSDVTAYLEREQYDTNLAVLNIKRQLMLADPTVKPSSVKNIEENIQRGEIYRDNEVPYELIELYRNGEGSISLSEWRDMGDPESDGYDPELYQKLWALDEMMTEAGVSYGKGSGKKQKYYAKKSGSGGRGRGGSKAFSSEFGKLGEIKGAPSVQAYDTIERQSGSVPVIQRQRPNIVHKIGFSG